MFQSIPLSNFNTVFTLAGCNSSMEVREYKKTQRKFITESKKEARASMMSLIKEKRQEIKIEALSKPRSERKQFRKDSSVMIKSEKIEFVEKLNLLVANCRLTIKNLVKKFPRVIKAKITKSEIISEPVVRETLNVPEKKSSGFVMVRQTSTKKIMNEIIVNEEELTLTIEDEIRIQREIFKRERQLREEQESTDVSSNSGSESSTIVCLEKVEPVFEIIANEIEIVVDESSNEQISNDIVSNEEISNEFNLTESNLTESNLTDGILIEKKDFYVPNYPDEDQEFLRVCLTEFVNWELQEILDYLYVTNHDGDQIPNERWQKLQDNCDDVYNRIQDIIESK